MNKNEKNSIACQIPRILLPKEGTDLPLWATVACDQYTSQPDYWDRVEKTTQGVPSTYHLMLPEIYLEEKDAEQRIDAINQEMERYMQEGLLRELPAGFLLVQRKTPVSPIRTGLVMALDLEAYDYRKGSDSLIRATEGTVVERIPPRMKIRRNACLEMPHIMILIDDPQKTVIEPLTEQLQRANAVPIYDFDLMEQGGHLRGYSIQRPDQITQVTQALCALADPKQFARKYQVPDDYPVLLYAVGDGNHSLASAKCHWDACKEQLSPQEQMEHPARYALVEVVNIHDEGIQFEPIHRVLFQMDPEAFLDGLLDYFGEKASCVAYAEEEPAVAVQKNSASLYHEIFYQTAAGKGVLYLDKQIHLLAVGALQEYIDFYLSRHPEAKVDYIHGSDVTRSLGSQPGNLGLLLPAMDKNDLFPTVMKNGALPRKTFSMGEAFEKRYYMECRRIR